MNTQSNYKKRFEGALTQNNKKLYDSFLVFIDAKNYRGSIKTYSQPILEFLIWTQKVGLSNIKDVKNADFVAYNEYLSNRPNLRRGGTLSDASINRHFLSLRLFFGHLLEQKMITRSIMISNRSDKTKINRKIASIEEIKQMFDACENQFETAVLSVAYGCGLRRTEIQKLNATDVKFSQGYLIVREGKGGKQREVPMSDAVVNDLRAYLLGERNHRIAKKKNRVRAFFVSTLNERASGWLLNQTIINITHRTGNQELIDKNITLHCLRHTIATHLANNGASMDFIKEFLGHALVDTSQIYAMKRKSRKVFKV